MKSICNFWIAIVMLLLLTIGSCSKNKENNTNVTTLKNVDAIFTDISKHQKSNFDIAPIVLPNYITQSTDTFKEKIVTLVNLINGSRKKSVHLPFVTPKGLAQTESLQSDSVTEECQQYPLQGKTFNLCNYTYYENNGKLKEVYTRAETPTAWTLKIAFTGVDNQGTSYDNFIVYNDITLKDSTGDDATWYSQIFKLYPPCDAGPLWEFQTKTEGGGTLYFMGEEIPLTTYVYIVMTYDCGFLDDHNFTVGKMSEVKIPPDGTVEMLLYEYSYNIRGLYLWTRYTCWPDGSWDADVYDELGNVIKHEQWPLE